MHPYDKMIEDYHRDEKRLDWAMWVLMAMIVVLGVFVMLLFGFAGIYIYALQ